MGRSRPSQARSCRGINGSPPAGDVVACARPTKPSCFEKSDHISASRPRPCLVMFIRRRAVIRSPSQGGTHGDPSHYICFRAGCADRCHHARNGKRRPASALDCRRAARRRHHASVAHRHVDPLTPPREPARRRARAHRDSRVQVLVYRLSRPPRLPLRLATRHIHDSPSLKAQGGKHGKQHGKHGYGKTKI